VLAFVEITLIWHEKYTKKPTKKHYCDNIEYRDILTHDNRHQLFLISPIPSRVLGGMLVNGLKSMHDKMIIMWYLDKTVCGILTRQYVVSCLVHNSCIWWHQTTTKGYIMGLCHLAAVLT